MAFAGNRSSNNTRRSADRRLKYLDREMARHNYNQSGLLEILFKAHAMFGRLPIDILRYIALSLRLAPSRVYATATFYSQFSLRSGTDAPDGAASDGAASDGVASDGAASDGAAAVHICNGVTCLMNGADELTRTLGRGEGHATGIRCNGLCGHGPIAQVDGKTVVHATPEAIVHALTLSQMVRSQSERTADGGAT